MDNTYNGWKGFGSLSSSYNTWLTALWLSNTEIDYLHWREMARDIIATAVGGHETWTKDEEVLFNLTAALKEEFDRCNPLVNEATFWSDLMASALEEINFEEIAEHILEEVREET